MKRLLLYFFLVLPSMGFSQYVNLLKDINSTLNASGSNPANFTNVAGTIFFTATDQERGTELWKTDGTLAGTVLIKDIRDGSSSSSPSQLLAIGSTLYFRANDGVNGSELWKSDGTSTGTAMVKDINPGSGSSSPFSLTNVNSVLFFSANDGTNGSELWKSDGTTGGTSMITNIESGAGSSSPSYIVNAGGIAVFQAYQTATGYELWRSDGTAGGTFIISDIYAGGANSSNPFNLVYNGSVVYFVATTAATGYELFKSGTTAGSASLVEDIYAGTTSSNPAYLINVSGTLYFTATTSANGNELWKSTGGTAATTDIVEDLVAGTGSSSPYYLTNASGTVYFSAQDAAGDRELYTSQGTAANTGLKSNINTVASTSSNPSDFEAASGGLIFYSATTNSFGTEFFSSDNSTASTWLADINSGAGSSSPANKAFVGGNLYLAANNGTSGSELWLYNGSSTTIVKDINGGSEDSYPDYFVNNGTTLFFQASTTANGAELWSSNGTSGGTVIIKDINATGANSSYATPIAYNNSLLFLSADNGVKGTELWKSNGTDAGTLISEINTIDETGSYPTTDYAVLGSNIYFQAYHPTSGYELYKSDGTITTLVSDIYSGTTGSNPSGFKTMGSFVYFSARTLADGYELWRTNGTTTSLVRDINIGSTSSSPAYLTVVGSTLYFSCNNGSDGTELYKSDGNISNASLVKDINVGGSSYPYGLTNVGGVLFFVADDAVNGYELWKSTDGTSGNTTLVKDIYPGVPGSSPNYLTVANGILYFQAYELATGSELYKSDGTLSGTSLVKDIFSGSLNGSPSSLTTINGTLYFLASDGTGFNLMKTNGTAAGTIVATSNGVTYQAPSGINYLNNNVYFAATTNTYGREILYVKAEPLNQPTVLNITSPTATTLNLSFTAAAGAPSGYIVVRNGGSAPTGIPVDGPLYTANTAVGGGGTGTVAYVGSGTSFTDTGLSSSTNYFYAVYSYAYDAASGVYIYRPSSPLTGNNTTLASVPVTQANGISFSALSPTSMTINWTNGSGSERLVIANQATAVATNPTPGVGYTGNSVFSSAPLIGTGRVVYRGSGNLVTVTGLANATTYHFRVYELNGVTSLTNYNLNTATNNPSSQTTLVIEPTTQASSVIFSSVTSSSVTVNFTIGDGTSRGLIAKAGSTVDGLPVDGTAYVANTIFGSGSQIGTGNYVVGLGSGPITVTGLSPATTYHFRVFEFNGSGATINFNVATATGNPNSFTTLAASPTAQATSMVFSSPTINSMTVSYTAAAGSPAGYIAVRKQDSAPAETPVAGTTYSAGNTLGTSIIAYVGSGLTFNNAGLTGSKEYYYAIYAFNGTGSTINYLLTSPLTGNRTTLNVEPTNQPTALIFSSVGTTSLTVGWTASDAVRYIVIRKAGSLSTDLPVDGIAYPDGSTNGSSIVAFTGTTLSFNDSGLTPGTDYYYSIYGFNGVTGANNYKTTSPLTGSQTTLVTAPTAQPTALLFSNRTTTSIDYSFTSSGSTNYLILRKQGSSPTEVPVNGTVYTAGASFGSSTVVSLGANTSGTDNGLTAGTDYFYSIFSFNGTGVSSTYLTTSPLQGSSFTLASEPTAQPTSITFSNVAPESLTVSFTAATGTPSGYLVIRREGAAPTGVPQDAAGYAAGDALGDATVAYVGPATTFNDSGFGLTGEKTYYYQIFSFNGSATTLNYLTTSPLAGNKLLLAYEPISQATVLTFTNITASSFTVSFTAAANFPTGYLVVRKTGSSPSGVPVDGTVYALGASLGDGIVAYAGTGTTFNETLPLAAYFYDVFTYNGTTGTINYLISSPLEGSLTLDSTPPTFTNSSSNPVSGLQFLVSVKVEDTQSGVIANSVTLEHKAISSGASAFSSKAMTLNTTNGRFEFEIPAAEIGDQGVEYKVKATNAQGVVGTSPDYKGLNSFQQGISLPQIPAGSAQTDYRIIAIPVTLSSNKGNDVFEELGAVDANKWRMYRYENQTTTEITNLASLTVEPGKGYWLISKNAVTISTGQGTAVDATSGTPFTINLVNGWNQIGNPYLFNLIWADVNTANGTNLTLRTYNGGFNNDTKLDKFEGGFVSALSSVALKIPTTKNPSGGRVADNSPAVVKNSIDMSEWNVLLELKNENMQTLFGGVGMSPAASVGHDDYDDFTMPRFLDYLELNHPKKVFGMTFTKDVVPTQENYTWEFSVETNQLGNTEIIWDNSYFRSSAKSIFLFDRETKNVVDMKQKSSYVFSASGSNKFAVVYGSEKFTGEFLGAERLHITTLFPVPSQSSVTIGFNIPQSKTKTEVQVKVINLLGQVVDIVYAGNLDSGYQEITWSGNDHSGNRVSQGIYLVSVSTADNSDKRQLIMK